MRYTFELFVIGNDHLAVRKHTSVGFKSLREELDNLAKDACWCISMTDNVTREISNITTIDALDAMEAAIERNIWKAANIQTAEIREHGKETWAPFTEVGITVKTEEKPEAPNATGIAAAVNPSHYKTYCKDMQWLETMQYLPAFRNPDCFKAAVELQARKYLDRLGKKDNEAQEILKSIWYLRFLAAYIAKGNQPICVDEIDALLEF